MDEGIRWKHIIEKKFRRQLPLDIEYCSPISIRAMLLDVYTPAPILDRIAQAYCDDEEIMRDILDTLLTREGYAVRLVGDAATGLELARTSSFDAAIVDVMMPGMDGITALDELKKIDEELPVLMITAYASVENAIAAMKRGASCPVEPRSATPSQAIDIKPRQSGATDPLGRTAPAHLSRRLVNRSG